MVPARHLHVVMLPFPVQGQITPMMQLAQSLTKARPSAVDIVVTMVHNRHNFDRLQDQVVHRAPSSSSRDNHAALYLAQAAASVHNSKIQLTWVENGLPPDFYNDLTGANGLEFFCAVKGMKEPFKQLLQSLNRESPPVSCVLFGTLCPWTQAVAAELGLPTLLFWTQSAAIFSMYYHMSLLKTNGFFPYKKPKSPVEDRDADPAGWVTYIPGLPPLRPSSFPTLLQVDNIDDPGSIDLLKEHIGQLKNCDGMLINSFEDLEKDALQALRHALPCPLFSVGPLLPSAFLEDCGARRDLSIRGSLLQEKSDCIEWLDGQKQKHSVLYIAFGSIFKPSAEDMDAIATGIKSRKQPYLWAIRKNLSLPKGFVEDTEDYGRIVTWAPQLQVLSHPSVGAFLTHCGWNSTLESLSMGMPMICFPIFFDQPTNSTYVCDVWQVGLALKRQEDGNVKSEDVELAMRTVLCEEEGREMRVRASKLRDSARQAVQVNGSSNIHVQGFIQALQHPTLR